MNISCRWLRELVPGLDRSPQELADRLAMLGAPVDEVVDIGGTLRDVVIGRVERAERHPNADRLSLCRVDAGTGETLQVVCGAPNVRAGAYYPFAPVGATLPGDFTIKRAKIRGSASEGMLCSARELGLGREHEGILELHGEFEPGSSFVAAVGLDDARLAVDVTPNRPDLLSHVGVAREIAAAEGRAVALAPLPDAAPLPELALRTGDRRVNAAGVTITVEDADLCARYCGLVIRGVQVAPSPAWLAARLRALGLRPISNVVDATNFVLHELGQPLHAFDLERLGTQVSVRRARAGERITTLDQVDRALAAGMLVIADDTRPVAVAGVMGGADTEVHDDTRDILLECALFDPASVRATRRALNLGTDASYRFERGVDPDTMLTAARRAAELITAVAGGSVDPDVGVCGAGLPAIAPIVLRTARVEQILGVSFTPQQIAACLEPLGFGMVASSGSAVTVSVPGHRRYDVAREEDLIEEIARRHGYDAFPDELRPFRSSAVPTHPLFALEDRLRALLVARGFMEAHTAAFAPEAEGDVALMLPLAATESRLRRALVPGLLRRVESNFARGARSIRLFEIGTAFAPDGADGLPVESTRLAVVCTGQRRPPHWTEPHVPFDIWDIKALTEELADTLNLAVRESSSAPLLDPALSFSLVPRDNEAPGGAAGRVRDGIVDAPAWADEIWALEVEIVPAMWGREPRRMRALAQHPGTERDLALLVPAAQTAGSIAAAIRDAAGALLVDTEPFDVYSGKGVPEGLRSIAFRLRFQAPDRTLTDTEVDAVVRRVLSKLSEIGVEQRA